MLTKYFYYNYLLFLFLLLLIIIVNYWCPQVMLFAKYIVSSIKQVFFDNWNFMPQDWPNSSDSEIPKTTSSYFLW